MIRFIFMAVTVIVALIVTPYALDPALNSADFIVAAAPVVVVLIAAAGRGRIVKRIDSDHPDGLGSLDLLERERRRPDPPA